MVWEYMVVYLSSQLSRTQTEQLLDKSGIDRWELIAVIYNSDTNEREYYFKRELLVPIR